MGMTLLPLPHDRHLARRAGPRAAPDPARATPAAAQPPFASRCPPRVRGELVEPHPPDSPPASCLAPDAGASAYPLVVPRSRPCGPNIRRSGIHPHRRRPEQKLAPTLHRSALTSRAIGRNCAPMHRALTTRAIGRNCAPTSRAIGRNCALTCSHLPAGSPR